MKSISLSYSAIAFAAFAFLLLPLLLVSFTGCASVKERLGPAGYAIAGTAVKVYTHGAIRKESRELMLDYLAKHPGSAERLPALNAAWIHFWEGGNPFTQSDFEDWRARFLADRPTLELHEIDGFNAAADLLWEYLEAGADADGYVSVSPRTRRIVDSFVDGLRQGYAAFVSATGRS